jgi:phosphatidylglycerophosphate synthase
MRVMPVAPDSGALRDSALASILPALAAGSLVAAVLGEAAGLTSAYALRAMALLGAGGVLVWRGLPEHRPHLRFGLANQLTLLRAVAAALLAAMIGEPAFPQALAFGIAVAAALLDAVDGRAARRQGMASRFGARFDMETDALLILTLAVLLWQGGLLGPWVLLGGLLRYAFIGVARLLPRLRGDLAPSRRRQSFAVLQVVALLAALAPFVPRGVGTAVAAAALVGLCASFAVDVRALWRSGVPAR